MNMVYDQQFYPNWHVFIIVYFLSFLEPSMGVSGVGPFPVCLEAL